MSKQCTGPECDRPAEVGEFCGAHYMQKRRNGELQPLQSGDSTEQVSFRCSPELKRQVTKAAKRDGVSLTEWWIRAAKGWLK